MNVRSGVDEKFLIGKDVVSVLRNELGKCICYMNNNIFFRVKIV